MCIGFYFLLHLSNYKISFMHTQPPLPNKNCNKKNCFTNFMPVCGSDGKTYGDSCLFDTANCQSGGKLTSKRGKCLPINTPPLGPSGQRTCPPGQYLYDPCLTNKVCNLMIPKCVPNITPASSINTTCKPGYTKRNNPVTGERRPLGYSIPPATCSCVNVNGNNFNSYPISCN